VRGRKEEDGPVSDPKASPGRLVLSLVYVLIFPALLLLLSGSSRWIEGWLFSAWYGALCFTTILWLYRRDPALLAERYQRPGAGNQKGWDVYVVVGIAVGFVAWIVIIPLDAKRYAWSPGFPVWLKAVGCAALLASSFLFFRSYTDNTYLSPLVRIQRERKQQVVSTGVYGVVRHPMYLGGSLLFLGGPLLMGSRWGLGIGATMVLLLAGRIVGEEKMLGEELEGYAEYKKRVRSRLLPFVW
jgi:protein-S-isoprenylcysteine O-methyltransferase Ste14